MDSNSSHQHQDHKDQKDKAESAAWRVAPAFAVAPGGECSEQSKKEDDQKDGGHECMVLGFMVKIQ